jgi:hypothetical protein
MTISGHVEVVFRGVHKRAAECWGKGLEAVAGSMRVEEDPCSSEDRANVRYHAEGEIDLAELNRYCKVLYSAFGDKVTVYLDNEVYESRPASPETVARRIIESYVDSTRGRDRVTAVYGVRVADMIDKVAPMVREQGAADDVPSEYLSGILRLIDRDERLTTGTALAKTTIPVPSTVRRNGSAV